MNISKLSGLLFLIGLMVLSGLACEYMTIVSGTAMDGFVDLQPIKQGSEISVNCSGVDFQSTVLDEGTFSIPVTLKETSCSMNDLRYNDPYGATAIYECATTPNCSFTITETDTAIDLGMVGFLFVCIEVYDCEQYCTRPDGNDCPAGPTCEWCKADCENTLCP